MAGRIVKIDGVENTDKIYMEGDKSISKVAKRAEVHIADPDTTYATSYQNFNTVEIIDDDESETLFKGYVSEMKPSSGKYDLTLICRGFTGLLAHIKNVIEDYTNEEVSDIIKDLIDKYYPSITYNNVQTTTLTLDEHNVKGISLMQELKILADMVDHDFWVDDNLDLHLEPHGLTESGQSINTATDALSWERPDVGERIINKVWVYGATGIAAMVEDLESQQTYGKIKEKKITDPEITTEAGAEARANTELNPDPIQTYIIKTVGYESLQAGDLISVTLSELGITAEKMAVISIKYAWPSYVTTLELAEYSWRLEDELAKMKEDIAALQARDEDDAATLIRIAQFYEYLEIEELNLTIEKRNIDDAFVIGHAANGLPNMQNKWGLGQMDAWSTLVDEDL